MNKAHGSQPKLEILCAEPESVGNMAVLEPES
jgi:hypothetical protein